MSETTPRTTRFIYRAARGWSRRPALYLVEWHRGSPVVATVEPVWRVASSRGQSIARRGEHDVVVRGPWEPTPSRRHDRARVSDTG